MTILHLGDHDPSTPEQIAEYRLPTAPPKETDDHYDTETPPVK